MRWRLLARALAGLLSCALIWGCYPGLLLEVATLIIMIMINNNIVNLAISIKGWDESVTLVIGCFNKSLPTKMLNCSKLESAYLCYSLACHIFSAYSC